MRFNPYLINTGAEGVRGLGNGLFQKNLKDNSAAPPIDYMHLNDVLEKYGFSTSFSRVLCIRISEQLGIQTCRLKPSDLKKVNLDHLGTAGDAAFQLLVRKHMHKLRRLQNFITFEQYFE